MESNVATKAVKAAAGSSRAAESADPGQKVLTTASSKKNEGLQFSP